MSDRFAAPLYLAVTCCAALVTILSGCATPASQFDAFAEKHQLRRTQQTGTEFRHVLYASHTSEPGDTLHVYYGGDGTPWRTSRPSYDPTPHNPLTIQLMLQDYAPSVFIGRPCYHGFAKSSNCNAELWTSARYSEAIVASMAQVTSRYAKIHGYSAVVLIGYSGGGVIATLVAQRLGCVKGLITVAANLDIDAWSEYHGYEPLLGSLNPAELQNVGMRVNQIHFYGAKDNVVSPDTADLFFNRNPGAIREIYPDFDHVCCWATSWPEILNHALNRLHISN